MTQKHYRALAAALSRAASDIPAPTFRRLVHNIADILAEENSRFVRQKFINAIERGSE